MTVQSSRPSLTTILLILLANFVVLLQSANGQTNAQTYTHSPPMYQVTGYYLPIVGLKDDEDSVQTLPRRIGPPVGEVDARTGNGWALRLSQNGEKDDDLVNVGVFYMRSNHDVIGYDEQTLDAHSLYLDGEVNLDIEDWGPFRTRATAAIGVGGSVYDFSGDKKDTGGAAGMLRGGLELSLHEHLQLTGGAGYFLWGYPGETLGHGGFIFGGVRVRF